MREYVETWKCIAAAVGRSESWCRYAVRRAERPLPAFRVGGVMRMNLDELGSWIAAERAAWDAEQVARRQAIREAVLADDSPRPARRRTDFDLRRERTRAAIDAAVAAGELAAPEALGG